jgi:hypothetical protein
MLVALCLPVAVSVGAAMVMSNMDGRLTREAPLQVAAGHMQQVAASTGS